MRDFWLKPRFNRLEFYFVPPIATLLLTPVFAWLRRALGFNL